MLPRNTVLRAFSKVPNVSVTINGGGCTHEVVHDVRCDLEGFFVRLLHQIRIRFRPSADD